MNPQAVLFYESIFDALRGIVERAGGNKAVGARLRPAKAPDQAGRWLADCLNPTREERLDPDDFLALLRIGREIGFHGAMDFIAQEAGYQATPIEPQDEQARLQREFIKSVEALQRIEQRLGRLATAGIKAVA